jgi:hypothetical protein
MLHEFKIVRDLYTEPDLEGNSTLIKRGIVLRQLLELDEFSITEVVSEKGRVYKNRCGLMHRDLGQIVVMHKYDEIKRLKQPLIIKGFR